MTLVNQVLLHDDLVDTCKVMVVVMMMMMTMMMMMIG